MTYTVARLNNLIACLLHRLFQGRSVPQRATRTRTSPTSLQMKQGSRSARCPLHERLIFKALKSEAKAQFWPSRHVPPRTAFGRIPAVHRTNFKRKLRAASGRALCNRKRRSGPKRPPRIRRRLAPLAGPGGFTNSSTFSCAKQKPGPSFLTMTNSFAGSNPPCQAARERRESRLGHFTHNLRRETGFFIWIRGNSLKSPDSDE
jgi:hypothetical protein